MTLRAMRLPSVVIRPVIAFVEHVLAVRPVAQITGTVVGGIAVPVQDFLSVRTGADESCGDHLMHSAPPLAPISRQRDVFVSARAGDQLHDPAAGGVARETPDAPQVRHEVEALVTGYRQPSLGRSVIHSWTSW